MKITVKVFGVLAEKMGLSETMLSDIRDTTMLAEWLRERYPSIGNLKFKVAINRTIVNEFTTFENGSEIALLPPFSGG